jgi:hypothetical protein
MSRPGAAGPAPEPAPAFAPDAPLLAAVDEQTRVLRRLLERASAPGPAPDVLLLRDEVADAHAAARALELDLAAVTAACLERGRRCEELGAEVARLERGRRALQRMLAAWLPGLHELRGRHKGLIRWAVDIDPLAI